MSRRWWHPLAIALSAVLYVACGGSPASPTNPPLVEIARLIVAGTPPALGGSTQFTSIGVLADGSQQTLTTSLTWRSSDTSVATVSSDGVVRGMAVGRVEVSASYGRVTGMLAFNVTPAMTYTLSGQVLDALYGTPVAGATVTVGNGSGRPASTHTDEDGRYSIGSLVAGTFEVAAVADGYARAATSFPLAGDKTFNVRLSPATSCPTLGFDDLVGNKTPFTRYTACGFTITTATPNWMNATSYGHPAPFIQFVSDTATGGFGELIISAAGTLFRFEAMDVYSSVTPI